MIDMQKGYLLVTFAQNKEYGIGKIQILRYEVYIAEFDFFVLVDVIGWQLFNATVILERLLDKYIIVGLQKDKIACKLRFRNQLISMFNKEMPIPVVSYTN